MADYGSLQSPKSKSPRPTSSFFNSPKIFTSFASKGLFETDSNVMSPTSTLDTKPFCGFKHTTKLNNESQYRKHHWEGVESKRVGLGIVDALMDEEPNPNLCKPESRMLLFGSQLKIQIPLMPNSAFYPIESPKLPPDFGIKSRSIKLGPFSPGKSPSSVKKSAFGYVNSGLERSNSSETEFSDESFCVIPQGPNAKTNHVFENCIVDSCCGVVGYSASKQGINGFTTSPSSYPSEKFLSFCFTCRKNLGHGKDIYMYRGEKAFCSRECRYQEMLLEEEMEKFEFDDGYYGACS